jgi:hypothetical protein
VPFAALTALLTALVVVAPVDGATPKPVRVELYRQGDFVSQTNSVQCIGASMQMMLNMIEPRNDRSARTQLALQRIARSNSPKRIGPGGVEFTRPRRGASSFGWAAGLSKIGGGPYRVTSAPSLGGALRLAARAMRDTRRPVGLLVWHGAHAWVMSGFEATRTKDGKIGRIRAVTVLDPWYPRSSRTYGSSPGPGTRLTPRQLSADFLRWHRHFRSPFDGEYVVVIPYRPVEPPQVSPVAPSAIGTQRHTVRSAVGNRPPTAQYAI